MNEEHRNGTEPELSPLEKRLQIRRAQLQQASQQLENVQRTVLALSGACQEIEAMINEERSSQAALVKT